MKIIVKNVLSDKLSGVVCKVLEQRFAYLHKKGEVRYYSESIETLVNSPDVWAESSDEIILTSVDTGYLRKISTWLHDKQLKTVTAYVTSEGEAHLHHALSQTPLRYRPAIIALEALFQPMKREITTALPGGAKIVENAEWRYVPSAYDIDVLKSNLIKINGVTT